MATKSEKSWYFWGLLIGGLLGTYITYLLMR